MRCATAEAHISNDRRYPARPILGVGAIIIQGRSVLLVKRGNPPLQGEWSLPGGAVEAGERLEEAVRREILEETGLILASVRQFEIFERIIRDSKGRPEYHYVLVDYLCDVGGGTACASSDASACRWVPETDLRHYAVTEGTVAVIERAFRTQ